MALIGAQTSNQLSLSHPYPVNSTCVDANDRTMLHTVLETAWDMHHRIRFKNENEDIGIPSVQVEGSCSTKS